MNISKNILFKSKIICFIIFCLLVNPVMAEINPLDNSTYQQTTNQLDNFNTQAGYANNTTLESVIASIVQYLLSFLGVIFVILIIYAGFLWMTARGDSEQVAKSKQILIDAVIGLIIVLSSYIITTTILANLGQATG